MPSPFPGTDPYIEGHSWPDFHFAFMAEVRKALIPQVRPNYLVRAQEYVYLEHVPENGRPDRFAPAVSVVPAPEGHAGRGGGAATAVAVVPTIVTLPMPVEERQYSLRILWRETMEVVTAIEMLSPGNKRPGSDGRRDYLAKRETLLLSGTHLVELDLLRGGARLPTEEPLPPADYYAFVCRRWRRPKAQVYHWSLFDPMPTLPIPLAAGDPDVTLDLQGVFNTVYDRSDYDYSLDYARPLTPPLGEADAERVRQALRQRQGA